MNVLITSASRKVSLVREFQLALARSGGGTVVAVDASPNAPALYFSDRRFLVSPSTEPHFVEEILEICKLENVSLIIPTRDEELFLFAEARERFERGGARVMVPEIDTVRTCCDKMAFLAFCRQHHFGIPRTYAPEEWRSSDFPLFVKPRFGKGGQGARKVTSVEELRPMTDHPEQWVIQECVDWLEYTVDLLADFQGRVISVVPRVRQLVVAGESYVSQTVYEPHLIEESSRLAAELHLVGHNTIQCFWDGRQVKFVEVNPRFGGAAALGIAAGADTPEMLIRLTKGETLPPRPGRFQADLVMLRFTEDLFLKASARVQSAGAGSRPAGKFPMLDRGSELRAVLFDLDNTLYPEEQFVVSAFRATAHFLAARVRFDAQALFEQTMNILRVHGRGKVFDILLHELEIDSTTWLPTLVQVYRSHHPMLSLPPETAAILRALKNRGMRLGLVTDGPASTQRRKIAALGLEAYMDAIVCTGELGKSYAKPSPVPFRVALNLLDTAPESAAYVADDISKDFAGPNHLGMKSVQVRTAGLVGVRQKPLPNESAFRPQMSAVSLAEALALLGLPTL